MRAPGPLLSPGDTVGVVAPGFAVRRARLAAGVGRLRDMGYEVRLGRSVHAREGYLAGSDDARAADLLAMLADPEVRAIWFARGGYGTSRLLERVPWRSLRRRPRLFIGYSDLTALFCPVVDRGAGLCLHGPAVAELAADEHHGPSLRRTLAGRDTTLRLARRHVLAPGRARGRLIGGNLTVLAHLCGTPFAPSLRDRVLFLEEVGEQVYQVDRCLTQLRLAGALDGVAAVLLGHFGTARRRAFPPDRALDEVLRETFAPLGVPVVAELPAGHVRGKRTLPLGGIADVDTAARRVRFEPTP